MSPTQLLTSWQQFVDAALRGYQPGWYDFDNERRIRGIIQVVLDDRDVRAFPEANAWAGAVEDTDKRYRAILIPMTNHPSGLPWWLAGVPRYAGPELASDLHRMYHTELERRQ